MGPCIPGPLGQACKIRLWKTPFFSQIFILFLVIFSPFTRGTKVLKGTAWARVGGAHFLGQLARQSPWAASGRPPVHVKPVQQQSRQLRWSPGPRGSWIINWSSASSRCVSCTASSQSGPRSLLRRPRGPFSPQLGEGGEASRSDWLAASASLDSSVGLLTTPLFRGWFKPLPPHFAAEFQGAARIPWEAAAWWGPARMCLTSVQIRKESGDGVWV